MRAIDRHLIQTSNEHHADRFYVNRFDLAGPPAPMFSDDSLFVLEDESAPSGYIRATDEDMTDDDREALEWMKTIDPFAELYIPADDDDTEYGGEGFCPCKYCRPDPLKDEYK